MDAFEYSTLKRLSRLLDIVMQHKLCYALTRQNSARETDSLGLWLRRVVAFMKHKQLLVQCTFMSTVGNRFGQHVS